MSIGLMPKWAVFETIEQIDRSIQDQSSKQERSELVIFDTNDYSHNSNDGSEAEVAIHSIADLEVILPSGNSRKSHDPIIIAGDMATVPSICQSQCGIR